MQAAVQVYHMWSCEQPQHHYVTHLVGGPEPAPATVLWLGMPGKQPARRSAARRSEEAVTGAASIPPCPQDVPPVKTGTLHSPEEPAWVERHVQGLEPCAG